MPILTRAGQCCICPTPLGSIDCNDLQTGIAEVYYTCPSNVTALAFLPDAAGCCDEAEISAFALLEDVVDTPEPEELLQPINFVLQDDDTGALHEFDNTSDAGNVTLNHTFTFLVNSGTPSEECALNKLLGKEVCLVIKYKSGKWRFINYTGGMVASQVTGNSNQSFTTVVISGRVNNAPLYISYSDNGAWADANLIPASLGTGGLINA